MARTLFLAAAVIAGTVISSRAEVQVLGDESLLADAAVGAAVKALKEVVGEKGAGDVEVLLRLGAEAPSTPAGKNEDENTLFRESYFVLQQAEGAAPVEITAIHPLGLTLGLYELARRTAAGSPAGSGTSGYPALPYRVLMGVYPVSAGEDGPETSENALSRAAGQFEASCQNALKHQYNFLVIGNSEDYMPWPGTQYAQRSERFLVYLKRFIEIAHQYHLRLLLIGDEFAYLPEYLAAHGATTSVKDPKLWEVLQQKYRELLQAVPELDGVATRIGEQIPKLDFRMLDVVHGPEAAPDPRIEERYRKFIQSVYSVAVGEFGKWYLHRTWVTNVHEQHSIADIFARTFTPDVPTDRLLLAIKLTAGDQWYYAEPFNATFGQTPHTTLLQAELYSGYQGLGANLDYPAAYFQAGLQWAVERGARGVLNSPPFDDERGAAIYEVFSRLSCDPYANLEQLTRDWAAAWLGGAVAEDAAKVMLAAPAALRDGLYLRPASLRNWNPLPHVRVRQFVVKGVPDFDQGKAHDAFLRGLYLECRPWLRETEEDLERGQSRYRALLTSFNQWRANAANQPHAELMEEMLRHGDALLRLNQVYAQAFFRYFRYREDRSAESKRALRGTIEQLQDAIYQYEKDFDLYDLIGIKSFADLALR
ncbi:MAG: hypothetical protein HYV26_15415, partial [Candidatus Hydrogenedentes bacterium]|nr:hypothetical protein [Candidatus Hydrogenedentota bacterium]